MDAARAIFARDREAVDAMVRDAMAQCAAAYAEIEQRSAELKWTRLLEGPFKPSPVPSRQWHGKLPYRPTYIGLPPDVAAAVALAIRHHRCARVWWL